MVPKSRLAYILLGIFLGGFGVHNFYAGYILRGVLQLICTIASCFILPAIVWVWVILEICFVTRDAKGIPFTS